MAKSISLAKTTARATGITGAAMVRRFGLQTRLHKLAARYARGLLEFLFPQTRGSRECRVRAAPAVSCAKSTKESAHEQTGSAEAIRHSLRNGLTAYVELSPATNSSCHRRCRLEAETIRLDRDRHRQFDTSNGCQDHTILPYAKAPFVLRAMVRSRETRPANPFARRRCRVHRIPSRVS